MSKFYYIFCLTILLKIEFMFIPSLVISILIPVISFSIIRFVATVVSKEKETKLKESLKIIGMTEFAYGSSQVIGFMV